MPGARRVPARRRRAAAGWAPAAARRRPRPARPGQVEARGAGGTGQHRAVECAARERGGARRACVAVGEQRAVHVGHEHRGGLGGHRGELALGQAGHAVDVEPPGQLGHRGAIGAGCSSGCQRRAECRRCPGGPCVGSSSAPSTSSPRRSGAVSIRARSIASSSVAEDAAHPRQLPSRRSLATPSSMPRNSTFAAVGLHVRPHAVQRLEHPLLQRHRIQPVDQEQAADRGVARQLLRDVLPNDLERPLEPLAVQLEHSAEQLLGDRPRTRIGDLLKLSLKPLDPGLEILTRRGIGERLHTRGPRGSLVGCRTGGRRRRRRLPHSSRTVTRSAMRLL